jgi:DUF1680 family protein
VRLPWVYNNPVLLSGFENNPGTHNWQGEHIGKWLHAATLATVETGDPELSVMLHEAVNRLLATQLPNGYIGTYAEPKRYYVADVDGQWDVWTSRYVLYGLLTYQQYYPNPKVMTACEKLADLLISTYTPDGRNITDAGTRHGLSALTLLESMAMFYQMTGEEKYLHFAEHMLERSEQKSGLKVMSQLLNGESVMTVGDGKAYQLMAVLMGSLRLYQATGEQKYFDVVKTAWNDIEKNHLTIAGGPWGIGERDLSDLDRVADGIGDTRECFASPEYFIPYSSVEECAATSWVQLSKMMLEITGEAKYANHAERTLLNTTMTGQHKEGLDGTYFMVFNRGREWSSSQMNCCNSSRPRAFEEYARHRVGIIEGRLSFSSLMPGHVDIPAELGGGKLVVSGNSPVAPNATIKFEQTAGKKFAVEFCAPWNTDLESVTINGQPVTPRKNSRGFYSLEQVWKAGDVLDIAFIYPVRSWINSSPLLDKTFISFTYGPWVLGQKMGSDKEPFLYLDESKALNKIVRANPDSQGIPVFHIVGTSEELRPCFDATDLDRSGVKAYFLFRNQSQSQSLSTGQVGAEDKKPVTGVWQPLPLESTSGMMGKRFDLYRTIRVALSFRIRILD